ncbi:MAG TPA: YdcF family protein, partial [Acetobacteraceae bacterium]|nr:YdcF family protein [Acetobacteraceae bacterium]
VAAAIDLLQANRGRLLLISGVGPDASLADLFHGTGIDPASLRDRITIGRAATDTLGNAAETAAWVRDNDLHSLIVVTAGYHMKRALTEFGRALPGVTLYPAPVVPPALRAGTGLHTLRLLADEYTKWLAAKAGLTRLRG